MKKVVCPACGLVNLEKFVTYPHCAACGALLSSASAPRLAWWKRPVRVTLWATILGLCCAALGIAGILVASETRRLEENQLVVYPQIPRRLRVGQIAHLRLGLDSIETTAGARGAFEALQLRLPRSLLKDFALISISPLPPRRTQRGGGLYFDFGRIERDQNIAIALRPLRSGNLRLSFSVSAHKFSPYEWSGNLPVRERVTVSAP